MLCREVGKEGKQAPGGRAQFFCASIALEKEWKRWGKPDQGL